MMIGVAEPEYFKQLGHCWKLEAKLAAKSSVVMRWVSGLRGLSSWITEHPDEAFSFIFLLSILCSFYFQVKLGYQPFKELVANASVSIRYIERLSS